MSTGGPSAGAGKARLLAPAPPHPARGGGSAGMRDRLDWERDDRDWPNREHSRFVEADGMRWHVQIAGSGPHLLLVHGTGASTHSFAPLLRLLAGEFTVIVPDLPGHGFTSAPPRGWLSLPQMAKALAGLLAAIEARPEIAVGHSAGAAILARMSLAGLIQPKAILSLNGALLPLPGLPGHLFSPLAKMLASFGFVPKLFAWRAADPRVLDRLIEGTGSRLDPVQKGYYARLASTRAHVAAALGMMAHWDLGPLGRDLPRLPARLVLVAASNDRTVPPAESRRVQRLVRGAQLVIVSGLGHLAHEEDPGRIARLVRCIAADTDLPASA